MADPTASVDDKAVIRTQMRAVRRAIEDRGERSLQLWAFVAELPAVMEAQRVVVFDTIAGEPETEGFVQWCVECGKNVATPEDVVEPTWPDVVVVPGLAFTPRGDRLGQGGGWYDQFLAQRRADCVTVGVCFHEQLVSSVPVEPHDVTMDHVVTERGPVSVRSPSGQEPPT